MFFFFFNQTAPTRYYTDGHTRSLTAARPIGIRTRRGCHVRRDPATGFWSVGCSSAQDNGCALSCKSAVAACAAPAKSLQVTHAITVFTIFCRSALLRSTSPLSRASRAPANAPCIHPHCPRGDACAHASSRELFLQQAIQSIRIGLALRRTHGLADEEAEQLVLAGAIFGELAGILPHPVLHRGADPGL